MENSVNDSGSKGLMNELVEGRDLIRKLQMILSNESGSSSNEAYCLMTNNILAKFERSLQILQCNPTSQFQFQLTATVTTDSPNSLSGSPKSLDSDGDFKGLAERKEGSKKRRISPRLTQRVEGSPSSGLEGPIEDGYDWRKYGQKDILGANFPRAYCRCTHRVLQGCLATKQVQRSDDDPSFFDVTYCGNHTCSQAASSSSSSHLNNSTAPKLEPVDTLVYPPQPPHHIIWDFKRDIRKYIKPVISTSNNNINQLKSYSFSFLSSSRPLPNHSVNFVGRVNIPTNARAYTSPRSQTNNIFSDQNNQNIVVDQPQGGFLHQEVSHPSSTSATNSPTVASDLSFDHQGDDLLHDVFILDNPHYFQ